MAELNLQHQDHLERLLDVQELAEALRIKKSWIYNSTRQGLIPCVKVGKYYRFYLSEVLTWLKGQAE